MIDRSWLDERLGAAMYVLRMPLPAERWDAVLEMWCTILGDCDTACVEAEILRAVELDTPRLLTPGVVKARIRNGVSIGEIQKVTCEISGLSMTELKSPRRARAFARPRQVAMVCACDFTSFSLPQIGRAFHRDHTTVIHARRTIGELMPVDQGVRNLYHAIEARVA